MAARIYVNTFGKDEYKVFSLKDNYHAQIHQALTERGYTQIVGSTLEEEEGGWMGKNGGYVVHAHLKGGGKAVYFMARDLATASKAMEAIRLSNPTIVMDDPQEVSLPE